MTDKELLQLAAKAAGYEYRPQNGAIVVDGIPSNWNPLDDDGDALRLAVTCELTMNIDKEKGQVRAEFEKNFPEEAALISLSENNRDSYLSAIVARHRFAAFSAGYQAGRAAAESQASEWRCKAGEMENELRRAKLDLEEARKESDK